MPIRTIILFVFVILSNNIKSQEIRDSIEESVSKQHIDFLASDQLKGRVNFSKAQLVAARYLSNQFLEYGLSPYPNYFNFYHPYYTISGYTLPIYTICTDNLSDTILYNIVGVLPGKDKAEEVIIFSAHYDHIDKGLDGSSGSIFNGANDNASGVTAVLQLAKYFSMKRDNERTIIFCLFSGEELGLYGSTAFTRLIAPSSVKAVINIEMIGRNNRTKKNGFFVTGSRYSNFINILQQNLSTEKLLIGNDNQDISNLFQRSDNYPFAKNGIPAHTIMCSDDSETCYHQTCDDANRINIPNMTKIIRAIAKGSSTLINGQDSLKWNKKYGKSFK